MNMPTPQHPFKSRSFLHSLSFALNGLRAVFQTERNFRSHLAIAVAVASAACVFQVSLPEWGVLIVCMTLMVTVEALNTAIEYLVDMLTGQEYNEKAKLVKDISAGACLMTAVGVALAGAVIFTPHILSFLRPGV